MTAAWVPDLDCETHEWRSALGETIQFVTRSGAQARMMPPVQLTTVVVPQAQGGRFQRARHAERLLTLPVVSPGAHVAGGREELRRWARALDPLKGEGTLTVIQGAYAGRQLVCVYEAGLAELSEDEAFLGLDTLAFRAAEPYWQDGAESSINVTLSTSSFTWFPFLPLKLGPSDLFAGATVQNVGDVEAWPVVTVKGPGTDLRVANLTSGLVWSLPGTISDGSTLLVDTRPGRKSVRLNGANAFAQLSDDSVLWPLVPGPNRIEIGFAGAGVASSVLFQWRNRWLAA